MRMRRKKWARPELDACDFFIKNPSEMKNNWRKFFKNKDNELCMELGCGKGCFVKQIALANPNKNYIAIDISSDVLGVARRNITSDYENAKRDIDNIALMQGDIERILEDFGENDKIDNFYINFCNPWPKDRHKKRRLTHPTKLNKYKEFASHDAKLFFKTDDDELFEDTLTYLAECNMEVTYITRDLHNSDYPYPNYETEHEEMFTREGIPTKCLIANFFND